MSRLIRAGQLARLTRTSTLSVSTSPFRTPSASFARIPRGRVLGAGASAASLHCRTRCFSTAPPTPPPTPPPEDGKKPEEKGKNEEKKDLNGQDKKATETQQQQQQQQQQPQEENAAEEGKSNATETPKAEGEEEAPVRELPEGWVRLTEEDKEALFKAMENLPTGQSSFFKTLIADLEKYGAPKELMEMIRSPKRKTPTVKEMIKFTRIVHKTAIKIMEMQAKEEEEKINGPNAQQQSGDKQKSKEDKEGSEGQGAGFSKKIGPFSINDYILMAVTWFILSPFIDRFLFGESKEITWQELQRMFLDKGLVERFVVYEGRVEVQLNRDAVRSVYQGSQSVDPNVQYFFTIGSVDSFEKRLDSAQDDLGIPTSERIPVKYGRQSPWLNLLVAFGPTVLLVGLLMYSTRQMGGRAGNQMFGFGKSKAKQFNHETAIKVKFTDVAGMDEAKVEIMEFVSFLKSPEKFRRLGAKIPRGAILAGPPGTGKTLLAKATAGECEVPFFSVSGSEFVEMFVGVGPSRVRDLFATARKNAPCIIFIDEIDAIGRARTDSRMGGGGNDEREATLNQILTEMDGFNTADQVVVLAGTNRADILDKALMRPGRFDRHIFIDRPTQKGREAIFQVHLQKIVTQEDKEHLTGRLATLTPGFSGADIAHVVNEAALIAARANADSVTLLHFEQAIERHIGGLERKSLVLRPEEKKTVAYHEAGHAICGWFLKDADPLLKVSIIPRGQGALGYAQYLPQDAYLMSVHQLMDRMAMTLGGRVSEEIHFPTVTTGASDDFKKVTAMATRMVTQWGMSDKVGPIHFENEGQQLQKPFAEETGKQIDAEVKRIVSEAYKMSKDLLVSRKKEVGLVAEELLKKEVLTRDDLVRLLGPRPFADNHQDFEKYFGGKPGEVSPPFPAEETDTPPAPSAFEKNDSSRL